MGETLVALGAALLVSGILARGGRRLGLPTIPLFMVAGIVFGGHTPGLNFFEDPAEIELLAAVGLIFLLFYLGLEFSIGDLLSGGRKLVMAGAAYLALNIGGGLALGAALGWGGREALVIAGAVGISSSAIATKLLVELHRLANPETRVILGIIVVEDLFLALYLAILEPVIGDAEGFGEITWSIARAFLFLIVLAVVARKGAALVGRLVDSEDDELLTIAFVGLAVLAAGVAEEAGVSDAIGAFMIGLVLAESPSRERIERLVLPLRDTFAAIFFFAFGLTIDPADVWSIAGPIAIAVTMSVVLNALAGLLTARSYQFSPRAAANIGTTVLARGEFSLILASLAASTGLDSRIGPFIAGYVLILALGAPIVSANAKVLARLIPSRWFPAPGMR